jgi:hypothetical protein
MRSASQSILNHEKRTQNSKLVVLCPEGEKIYESFNNIKSSIFWDITHYTPLNVKPTFRWKMSPPCTWSKNKRGKKSAWKQVASRATGVISQKIGLFKLQLWEPQILLTTYLFDFFFVPDCFWKSCAIIIKLDIIVSHVLVTSRRGFDWWVDVLDILQS